MKNLSKYLILAALLQVVCHAHPVNAGGLPALSMDHFTMYVASFIEKMEKITAYTNEIKETTKTIESLGEVGVNAAGKMLRENMADFLKFADMLHFGDLGQSVETFGGKDLQGFANSADASLSTSGCPLTRADGCSGKDQNGCMYTKGKFYHYCPNDSGNSSTRGSCEADAAFHSGADVSACADLKDERYRTYCEHQYNSLASSAKRGESYASHRGGSGSTDAAEPVEVKYGWEDIPSGVQEDSKSHKVLENRENMTVKGGS